MRQTAVYLEEDQIAGLKRTSRKLGRSEAELIREGLDLLLARYRDPIGEIDLPTAPGGGRLAGRVDELLEDGFGHAG